MRQNHYYPFGLKHTGYNDLTLGVEIVNSSDVRVGIGVVNMQTSGSDSYNYKYQGQERQDEFGLGWDSFKWRNYDVAIGRFFNPDPLSEKYSYQSHYNFSENRVVDGRELEGLEWIRSTTINEDGSKTHTLSANIKVLNNTGGTHSSENIEKYYLSGITEQMKTSLNGETTNGDKVVIGEINYEMVSEVTSNDYYLEFTNQIVDSNGNSINASGKVDEIGNSQSNRIQVKINSDNRDSVATHEINHTLGNRHQNDPKVDPKVKEKMTPSNMMNAPVQLGDKVIDEQRDVIINNVPSTQ